MNQLIILATTSKYKIKIFSNLNIPFTTENSNVDESVLPRKNPKALVRALSKMKAEAVASRHSHGIIFGFDSVGFFNGQILEKPKNKKELIKRLRALSGTTHWAYTGIYAMSLMNGKKISKVVSTKIHMRKISDKEIRDYIKSDKEVLNYCLGYDPERGISASFVDIISGSYNNLLNGMPIEVIPELLEKLR